MDKTNTEANDDSFYDTSEKHEGQDAAAQMGLSLEEQTKQREEWSNELKKLEDDIHTLQSVLQSKIRQASELKRKLGITPLTEMKEDFRHGLQSIKESDAWGSSQQNLRDGFSKTSEAFKTFGAFTTKKIGEVRNSTVFKSVEEKMGGAYNSVKTKVSGSQSEQNLQNPGDDGDVPATAASTPGETQSASTPQ